MKLEQSNLIVKRAHKEVYKTEEGIVRFLGKNIQRQMYLMKR